MTTFNDREKDFEAKFKHDEELKFKVTMRRNKLLGLWIGELFGMDDASAEAYAREVIEADFEEPGEEDVVRKVMADIEAKGADVSDYQLRKKMEELMAEARQQIMQELPTD
ncbi:MAG: DUF1476 domain-containing protein [Alphaproteobacteria bacterium]|nr:DUF1476 domain-containing protein [Alphaproteobacteria bacterium]